MARYVRGFSFAGFQSSSPQKPLPGDRLDIELDNIAETLDLSDADRTETERLLTEAQAARDESVSVLAQALAARDAIAGMGLSGNVFATRAAAQAAAIAPGVSGLRLMGYSTLGLGAADYASIGGDPGHDLAFQAPAASGRWWGVPDFVVVNPHMVGGVGDNVANDQAAFDKLAVARPGGVVDLIGKTWLATSWPTGFQVFNGAVRVGTEMRRYRATPRTAPFEGGANVKIALPGQRRPYPGGVYYHDGGTPDTRELVLAVTSHSEHVTNPGDALAIFRSLSGGLTWSDEEVPSLALTEGVLGGAAVGAANLTAGVDGFVFSTIDAGGVVRQYLAKTSGGPWVIDNITAGGLGTFWHGPMLPIPASEGGGAGYWIASGYGAGGTPGVHVAWTSNGWAVGSNTSYVAKAPGAQGVSDATEACLVQTGPNAWWLIARRDGAASNFVACFSATPKVAGSWGPWIDTGVACNGNPHVVMARWGRLWLFAFARRSTPIDGYEDCLLATSLPLVGFNGAWPTKPAWSVVSQGLAHMTGPAAFTALPGDDLVMVYGQEETVGQGSFVATRASVGVLTTRSAPVSAPAVIAPRPPKIWNPDPALLLSPYGSSITAIGASKKMVGAGLWMARSGATVDAVREAVDTPMAMAMTHGPAASWRLTNGAAGGYGLQFGYRFYGTDTVKEMLRAGTCATRIWLSGQIPGYYYASMIVNAGTGGTPVSPPPSNSANAKQTDYVSGLYRPSVILSPPEVAANEWGTNGDATLDLVWTCNNPGTTFGLLHGVVWNAGDTAAEIEPYSFEDAWQQARDRVENKTYTNGASVAKLQADTSNNAIGSLRYAPKRAVPAISFLPGSAVAQLALNATTCATLGFDAIGRDEARVTGTISGALVAHSHQQLVWASATPGGFLINAESV